MKKRVSIYIDEGVWEVAKDAARERSVIEKRQVSASQVVENCILGMTENPVQKRFREVREDVQAHEIKRANERLLKKRIETKKGPVRANAAMDNFFNPMSKDRQLGKKKGVV